MGARYHLQARQRVKELKLVQVTATRSWYFIADCTWLRIPEPCQKDAHMTTIMP